MEFTKMSIPTRTTYDIATGETTVEPLTPQEIANIDAQEQSSNTAREEADAIKASARAKLAALGLTEEEISALVGGA